LGFGRIERLTPDVLLAKFGSVRPAGGVTVAVLVRVPVAEGETTAVTMKVTLLPGETLTPTAMLPVPLGGAAAPPVTTVVQVALVIAAGKRSVTAAPFATLGPRLVTTM